METALDLVSAAGGFAIAWVVHHQLDPWRKAARFQGSDSERGEGLGSHSLLHNARTDCLAA